MSIHAPMGRTLAVTLAALVCIGGGVAVGTAVAANASGTPGTSPAGPLVGPPPRPSGAPSRPVTGHPDLATPAMGTPATIACGQEITASVVANTDLSCPTTQGLYISGSNITVNLAGHIIYGNAADDGIVVHGSHDTVENGTVVGFLDDFVVTGGESSPATANTLSGLHAESAGSDGFLDEGKSTVIKDSAAWDNANDGIDDEFVSGASYSGNRVTNNGFGGIYVYGGKATLTSNEADSNAPNSTPGYAAGIYVYGGTVTLTGNTANFNYGAGIYLYSYYTVAFDGGGNTAKGNDFGTNNGANLWPLECVGVACN